MWLMGNSKSCTDAGASAGAGAGIAAEWDARRWTFAGGASGLARLPAGAGVGAGAGAGIATEWDARAMDIWLRRNVRRVWHVYPIAHRRRTGRYEDGGACPW
jgi:hypothetical protein